MSAHVVMFSGGVTSWATARRVASEHGTSDLTLLFADTLIEDDDLYRFLDEAAADIGVPVTRVADGRTPRQVFWDRGFLGNTRIAPCSHLLKQEPCRKWLTENTDPSATTLYVGIDWTETHRLPAIERGWLPWRVEAPLCAPPYSDKVELLAEASAAGIAPPRLYAMGFAHNNCGGSCVRGGQAQWSRLLATFPGRFAEWEQHEQAMRDRLGDVAILRDRRGGVTRPLPLAVLRRRIESVGDDPIDSADWGGCGCFTDHT